MNDNNEIEMYKKMITVITITILIQIITIIYLLFFR